MPTSRLPLRLLVLAALAIGVAVLLGLAIGTLNSLLELYERMLALPWYARLPLLIALAAALCAIGVLGWKLLQPARVRHPRRDPAALPSRGELEVRIADLRERSTEAGSLERELLELDRRRSSGECHVALFGEISTGKSSLIRALAADAATDVDVLGGTTRLVQHFRGVLPDGRELVVADVPGSAEVDGTQREQLARDEALRAHVVLYVVASDLTRAQDTELRWLAGFGKPLILVLNKADLFDADESTALVERFATRYADIARAVVPVSAGGSNASNAACPTGAASVSSASAIRTSTICLRHLQGRRRAAPQRSNRRAKPPCSRASTSVPANLRALPRRGNRKRPSHATRGARLSARWPRWYRAAIS